MEFQRHFVIGFSMSPSNVPDFVVDGNTPGQGIVAGSMHLSEILCEKEIEWGAYTSNKFEVTLYGFSRDVIGRRIIVYYLDGDNERHDVFVGRIDAVETDDKNQDRKIIAYDDLYFVRDIDVTWAWRNVWTNYGHETPPQKTLWEIVQVLCHSVYLTPVLNYELFNGGLIFDISAGDNATENALPPPIIGGFPQASRPLITLPSITFGTILSMLCELSGCVPKMTRDGKIEFVPLWGTAEYDINDIYEKNTATFEDYTTAPITGISVYRTSSELLYELLALGASTDNNQVILVGNIFLLSTVTMAQARLVLDPLMSAFSTVSYAPANIPMIVSDFALKTGNVVTTTTASQTRRHIVLSQTFSGPQLVDQELHSTAYGIQRNKKVSTQNNDIIQTSKALNPPINEDYINIAVDTIYDLPIVGKENTVYIIKNDNATYRWDDINLKYYCVGRDYTEISVIKGGNA